MDVVRGDIIVDIDADDIDHLMKSGTSTVTGTIEGQETDSEVTIGVRCRDSLKAQVVQDD